MAFDDSEESAQDGKPIYLLHFARTGKDWYYTNADQDIVFNSNTYSAYPIEIPNLMMTGDAKADDVSISIPATASMCQYLDSRLPSEGITVYLHKAHLDENEADGSFTAPTNVNDAPVVWVGEITMIKRPSIMSRVLVCNTLSLSLARGGLRLTWQRNCPHMLYAPRGCKVDKTLFAAPIAAITIVDGVTISAPEFATVADHWFDGGFMEWESEPGVMEQIGFESHVGTEIVVLGLTFGIGGGTNYVAYPGCDRTAEMCNERFNNLDNFGGIKHLPGTSPFDGRKLWY